MDLLQHYKLTIQTRTVRVALAPDNDNGEELPLAAVAAAAVDDLADDGGDSLRVSHSDTAACWWLVVLVVLMGDRGSSMLWAAGPVGERCTICSAALLPAPAAAPPPPLLLLLLGWCSRLLPPHRLMSGLLTAG